MSERTCQRSLQTHRSRPQRSDRWGCRRQPRRSPPASAGAPPTRPASPTRRRTAQTPPRQHPEISLIFGDHQFLEIQQKTRPCKFSTSACEGSLLGSCLIRRHQQVWNCRADRPAQLYESYVWELGAQDSSHLLLDGGAQGDSAHLGAHHLPELVGPPILHQPHQSCLLPVLAPAIVPAHISTRMLRLK